MCKRNHFSANGSIPENGCHLHAAALTLHVASSETSSEGLEAVDARLAELQQYMRRESDASVLAKDAVKQLEGISALDQKALAEVRAFLSRSASQKCSCTQGHMMDA